jgi:arsenate reductase (glutaredoxin)
VTEPIVQIFGLKKCAETRKAERWFKERRIKLQIISLDEKGLSKGELRSVAAGVGGLDALVDREGARYVQKGLKYAEPSAARIEQLLLDDPLLLKTPIVRRAAAATVGFSPAVWATWK